MSKSALLRALVTQRLTAAAEDICALFERTIVEYEQDVLLLTHNNSSQQQRPSSLSPQPRHDPTTGVQMVSAREDSAHINEPLQEQLQESNEFHIVIVGTENDEDESSVLHQRPTEENRKETNGSDCGAEAGCSSDPLTQLHSDNEEHSDHTDHSEDYSQEQTPAKRSYAMIPPDSRMKDRRPFSCSDCGRSFTRNSDLKRHMLVHTGEKPFRCPVCGKRFALKNNCSQHLKVVHNITHSEEETPKSTSTFTCSECGESFRQKSSFNNHMKIHMSEKPFFCSVCDKDFYKKSGLARHQIVFHHLCPICCKRFTDKVKFSAHLTAHVEEGTLSQSAVLFTEMDQPFSCPDCGKNFKDKSNFNRHRLVHTEERPHKCPVCGKRFKHKCHLTQHLVLCEKRSTTNGDMEKPHVCLDCGKGFLHKCSLGTHRKIHSGEKPFVCSVCGEGFITKAYLTAHKKRFHPNCGVCKKYFTDNTELKAHLRTHVEDGTL